MRGQFITGTERDGTTRPAQATKTYYAVPTNYTIGTEFANWKDAFTEAARLLVEDKAPNRDRVFIDERRITTTDAGSTDEVAVRYTLALTADVRTSEARKEQ